MVRYRIEDRPPLLLSVVLAFQHIFAAFGGIVVVPLIIASAAAGGAYASQAPVLVSGALVAAGVATILQTRRVGAVGSGLPIVMGTDFTFVTPGLAAVNSLGLAGYFGATILGSFVETVSALFLKPLRRLFPPVVTGSVVTLIGLSLLPVAVFWLGGGASAEYGEPRNLLVGLLVLAVIVATNQFFGRRLTSASVFIGLVLGVLLAIPFGLVDFAPVAEAPLLSFPTPLKYGIDISVPVLAPFLIAYMVTAIETIGDTMAVAEAAEHELKPRELRGAILADGVGSLLAGFLNAGPNTSFSQNVGIVPLTGVASRFVVGLSGILLVLLGLFSKLGALISLIPEPVLGGAGLVMFGMVASSGLKIMAKEAFTSRTLVIVAVTLASGLGSVIGAERGLFEQLPEGVRILLGSGISVGAVVAVVLNVILPRDPELAGLGRTA